MAITKVLVLLMCHRLARGDGYQSAPLYLGQQQVNPLQSLGQSYPQQAPYFPQLEVYPQPWQQPNPPQQQVALQPYFPQQQAYGPFHSANRNQPFSPLQQSVLPQQQPSFQPPTHFQGQASKCSPPVPVCPNGMPPVCIEDTATPYYYCFNGRGAFPWPEILKTAPGGLGNVVPSGSRSLLEALQPEPAPLQLPPANTNSQQFNRANERMNQMLAVPQSNTGQNALYSVCPCLLQSMAALYWSPGYPTYQALGQINPQCRPGQIGCFNGVVPPLSPQVVGYPDMAMSPNSGIPTVSQHEMAQTMAQTPMAQTPFVGQPTMLSANQFRPMGPLYGTQETQPVQGNPDFFSKLHISAPQYLTQPDAAQMRPTMFSGYQVPSYMGYNGYLPPVQTQWNNPLLGASGLVQTAPNWPIVNPLIPQRYEGGNEPKLTGLHKSSNFRNYLASQNFPVPGQYPDSPRGNRFTPWNPTGYQNHQYSGEQLGNQQTLSQPTGNPFKQGSPGGTYGQRPQSQSPINASEQRPMLQSPPQYPAQNPMLQETRLSNPQQYPRPSHLQQPRAPATPTNSQPVQPYPGFSNTVPQTSPKQQSNKNPITGPFYQQSPYVQNSAGNLGPQTNNPAPQNRKPYLVSGLSLLPAGRELLEDDGQPSLMTTIKTTKHHNRAKNKHKHHED